MTDINRNQGSVNYQRVIQVRRSLHPVNPEQMHEIIKAAGCSTRFADDGMAFFTHTVGRCEYPLNPCGSYTNKWVGEQCKAQGFTRPADYPAALAGAMLVATEQAARMYLALSREAQGLNSEYFRARATALAPKIVDEEAAQAATPSAPDGADAKAPGKAQ